MKKSARLPNPDVDLQGTDTFLACFCWLAGAQNREEVASVGHCQGRTDPGVRAA